MDKCIYNSDNSVKKELVEILKKQLLSKDKNPFVENFVSKDPYMNHFVSNTLSSSSPTAIDIELKYAMDLGKYIFAYCKMMQYITYDDI